MSNAYLDLRTSLERFLIDWSMRNLSDGSGSSFPTTGLLPNMIFYRTDQDKLYTLRQLPNTWDLIASDYYLFDFDNHSVKTGYPERPLVGVKAFSLACESGMFTINAMLGLSVFGEQTLTKHNRLIGLLFSKLYPGLTIPVQNYHDNTGISYDHCKVMDGSEVLPVVNTEVRAFQFIGITAGTGVSVKPQL